MLATLTIAPPSVMAPRRRLRHPVAAVDVDVHDGAELLGRLPQRGHGGADPRVVDEDVRAAELLDGGIASAWQAAGSETSVPTAMARPSFGLHEATGLLEAVHPPGAEHDVRARLRQRLGDPDPKPRRGARDDGHPAVEAETAP
jgi:hypothetical protein